MRSLGPDEEKLWKQVAATIRPLSRDGLTAAEPSPEKPRRAQSIPRSRPAAARPSAPPAAAGTLDSGWDRRLRTGSVEPDRVVDLHGHDLERAWSTIDRALERAIESGERVVLLITGHARTGDPPIQRGRIRAAVHHWLEASRHASSIAAVRGAHRRHGGGGSLYIILRRTRSKSTVS